MKRINWLQRLFPGFSVGKILGRRRRSFRLGRLTGLAYLSEGLEDRTLLAATVSLAGGAATVTGTALDENVTVDIVGPDVQFTDAGGITAGAGAVQVNANTVTVPFANITGNLTINLQGGTDSVTLAALSGTGGNLVVTAEQVNLTGTVTAPGVVTLNGPLDANGNLTSGSTMNLNGAVTLSGNSVFTANRINVNSTLDGAADGTLDATTILEVAGVVGGVTPLTNLTTLNASNRAVFSSAVTADNLDLTSASVRFGGDVVSNSDITVTGSTRLLADVSITSGGAIGDDMLFTGQVTSTGGTFDATIDAAAGNVNFNGAVGAAIDVLDVTAATINFNSTVTANTVDVNGATSAANNITASTGALDINGNLTLAGNVTLRADNGQNITVAGTIAGAGNDFTVIADAGTLNQVMLGDISNVDSFLIADTTTAILGDVGANDILVTATNISLGGNLTAATDDIVLNGAITLIDDVILTGGGAAGDDITLNGTVDSDGTARDLTLSAQGGNVLAIQALGGTNALDVLNINGTTVALQGVDASSISITADDLSLNAAVTATTTTIVNRTINRGIRLGGETSGSLSLSTAELALISTDTLNIGNGASGLVDVFAAITVDADLNLDSGVGVDVNGDLTVGGMGNPHSVTFNPATTLRADVTAFADITFNDAVTLGADSTLTTGGMPGHDLLVNSTIDDDGFGRTLNVMTGGGFATFNDAIGGGSALLNLNVGSANATFAAVTVQNLIDLHVDDLELNGAVTGQNINITGQMPGREITLGGMAAMTLSLTAAEIGQLQDGFGSINIGNMMSGDVTVQSAVTFNDPLVLGTGGVIHIDGNLTMGTLNDAVQLNGNVDLAANIQTRAGRILSMGNFIVSGNSVLDLTAAGAVPTGNRIDLPGNIDGPGNLTITTGTGGASIVNLTGQIGNMTPLASLTITNAANEAILAQGATAGNINITARFLSLGNDLTATTDDVTIDGRLNLTGNAMISSGGGVGDDVSITGQVTSKGGTFDFGVNAGAGDANFTSAIGANLANVNIQAENVVFGSTVVAQDIQVNATNIDVANTVYATTGNLALNGDVTLTGGAVQVRADSGTVTIGSLTGSGQNVTVRGNVTTATIGAVTGVGLLTVRDTATVLFTDTVNVNNLSVTATTTELSNNIHSATDILFKGNVTILGNLSLTTTGNAGDNLTITGSVNADMAGRDLTINTGNGLTAILGTIGDTTPLNDLTVTSGRAFAYADITVDNAFSWTVGEFLTNKDTFTLLAGVSINAGGSITIDVADTFINQNGGIFNNLNTGGLISIFEGGNP